jgi:predicted nucleotidyltransferase
MNQLKNISESLVNWASKNKSISRIWLYGSRIKGTYNEDSDLDIAVEIDEKSISEDITTYSTFETENVQKALQAFIPYKVHLEIVYEDTPHVLSYLKKQSVLIYEKSA